MMEVIVVDLMSTNIIVFIVCAMFWTVQLHLIWLAMDTAMMNPILQIVIMMVGTAAELAQTKNIVLIVCAMQDHQQVEIVSTKCNYAISANVVQLILKQFFVRLYVMGEFALFE